MPIVIAGLFLAFLVMMLFGGSDLDRALLLLLNAADTPRLDLAAAIIDWVAGPVPLIVLGVAGAAVPASRKSWRESVYILALVLSGWLLVVAAQLITADLRAPVPLPGSAGFGRYPDAHAAHATVTGFALAFLATRRVPARAWALGGATAFAMLAGAASLLLGTSWPSSVVGGWALGLAWILLLLRLAGADVGDGLVERAPSPLAENQGQIVRGHRDDSIEH